MLIVRFYWDDSKIEGKKNKHNSSQAYEMIEFETCKLSS